MERVVGVGRRDKRNSPVNQDMEILPHRSVHH